jgi:glutathione synthase/RimK-type ligase-like ATP-grasp enzyme
MDTTRISVWGHSKSGRKLARALGCGYNKRAQLYIRYRRLDETPNGGKEINSAESIRVSSNKFTSLKRMEKEGIRVPLASTDFGEVRSKTDQPIFGRCYYHSKGTDIKVYTKGRAPLQAHDYYIAYIPNEAEYRYHVAFGKVILCTKKVLAEGEGDSSLVRNHQGGKWKQVTVKPRESCANACIKAVKVLGLDFGAVDFLLVNEKPVVLEVNTAPGLEVENRFEAYVQAFKEALK